MGEAYVYGGYGVLILRNKYFVSCLFFGYVYLNLYRRMNLSDELSLLLGVVGIALSVVKRELLAELASNLFGNRKLSVPVSVLLILVLASIPQFITLEQEEPPVVAEEPTQADEIRDYVELAGDAVVVVDGIGEAIKENKEQKEAEWQATREQRWVYQLGDAASDISLLAAAYERAQVLENVCIFKASGGQYFLFKDPAQPREVVERGLDGYTSQLPGAAAIDLMGLCDRKEGIRLDKYKKLRLSDGKVKVAIYKCGK